MSKHFSQSGQGYYYSKELGQFEVRYEATSKEFTELSKASEFYESLDVPSAIWDLTSMPELLDVKYFMQND
jgi:hypothetical protein